MAEEDVLFGKNRHLFGGMEPSTMQSFSITMRKTDDGDVYAILRSKLPSDSTIPHPSTGIVQTVCSVGGAVIRKSTKGYPENEFDGELLADIHNDCDIIDTDIEDGKTYYYAAFPYSKQGVYNKTASGINRDSVTVNFSKVPTYVYGFDIDTADSNPYTRVSYPSDVDNANYKPVYMDFEADAFNYGSWNIDPGRRFMPRPCMLKYDGTVAYYLDHENYAYKEDGTNSDISNTEFNGNAMMEWSKIYTKRWEENGVYHFRCSNLKVDSDYECWCNYDINNNEIDHFYTGIYPGSNDGTRLRSLYTNPEEDTIDVMMSAAMANDVDSNKNWHIHNVAEHLLIQDLLILMGCNTNLTSTYGDLTTTSTGGSVVNERGLFYSANNKSLKIFGSCKYSEAMYGPSEFIAGWLASAKYKDYNACIKITRGTYDGTSAKDYGTSVTGYLELPEAHNGETSTQKVRSGYVNTMNVYPWGRLPATLDASSTTYECIKHALKVHTSMTGVFVATRGDYNINVTSSFNSGSKDNDKAYLSCRPCAITN